MKKLLLLVILGSIISISAFSQTSADIYLGLKKLNVLGSVLFVAAHPDDENTRLLSYFSKDKLYRTAYLSVTRGDGGQNLIGDEQGIDLGLIRTQELLAARRIDGAEQYFTRAYDFGFSKNPEETFTKWDKEKILSDVVWIIRKLQPDVIITRFPTTGEGGHGHHTASAILANEAFSAAADPASFPEQLKFVKPWQAKRVVWNTFNFGNNNTQSNDQFKFDVGAYNAVLGKGYGEIAAESRSQHKSQGFGVQRTRGEALEFFKTTNGTAPEKDLMDGVDVGWSRVPGGQNVAQLINNTINSFDFVQPQKSVPQLVQIYKALKALPAGYWQEQKLKEVQQLIEQASGLWLDVYTTIPYVAQTDSVRFNFNINNRLGNKIILKNIVVNGSDSVFNTSLGANKNLAFAKSFFVPLTKPVTQPYWLEHKMNEGYYNVKDQQLIGKADVQPAFTAQFKLNIEGEEFSFEKEVRHKYTDPVKGELYQPFIVVPQLTVYAQPGLMIFRNSEQGAKDLTIQTFANKNIRLKHSNITARTLTKEIVKKDTSQFIAKGSNTIYSFPITRKDVLNNDQIMPIIRIDSAINGNFLAMAAIHYDHIPNINYFYTDMVKVLDMNITTMGKRIGYIVGAGDKVPDALEQLGYEVTLLTEKDFGKINLQQFDAILSGVRAYNTNEWLNNYHDKLMSYVHNGGNLIVQYNTSNQLGPVKAKIGPYDFNITRTRVTDENAKVNFLKPEHPVLNFPNKINADDFKGWIQERSVYHAGEKDKAFETILAMSDAGENADDGSLIIAKYGKGYFTYTGLVFFRQLPAGVPGAYRLLANLIALNNKKSF